MEAVAGIADRIWAIQSRIAQLTPAAPAVVMLPTSTPTATTVGTSALSGTTMSGPASASALAFGAVLDQAVATGGTTAPGATAPGYGKALVDDRGIPTELRVHQNGRVPAEALSSIAGTNHRLWSPAARSFEALQAAASADGVTIGITDSYRTYETQVDLVRRKGLYSQGGLAATPGTSNHGWGMALDLRLDDRAQAWMRSNAGRFGFVEDVPREPWHWNYRPTH